MFPSAARCTFPPADRTGATAGKGGDIVFEIDPETSTLADFKFKRKYFAENGEDGKAKRCFGKSGADLVIGVPEGTLIRDKETGRILADMTGENRPRRCRKGRKRRLRKPAFCNPGAPGRPSLPKAG